MKYVWTIIGTLVVLALIALALIYSGKFNVAAAGTEGGILDWALGTTMDNSVRSHAAGITVPPLQDSGLVALGFDHYKEMCILCHGSPSQQPSEIGVGLNPSAPELSEAAKDWTPAELFWIVRNGVRMSAMPAFGATHTERELWAIVAFLQRLQHMSPAEYKAFESSHATAREEGTAEHDKHGAD